MFIHHSLFYWTWFYFYPERFYSSPDTKISIVCLKDFNFLFLKKIMYIVYSLCLRWNPQFRILQRFYIPE